MKRKRLLTALLSIMMIFVFAGCSNSSNQSAAASSGNGTGGNGNGGNRPAFQKPDVYGEVSAINGNKVTLKLLKIPQRRNGQNGGFRRSGANGSANGSANGGGANRANGGAGKGGMMRAKQYTGKVETIVIPNNVPITEMMFDQNGMSQMNMTLNQVTTGSTMSIYYNTDKKTIKSIRVQQPRTGNGQGTGNGQAGGNSSSNN
jgi:hypothetical protein